MFEAFALACVVALMIAASNGSRANKNNRKLLDVIRGMRGDEPLSDEDWGSIEKGADRAIEVLIHDQAASITVAEERGRVLSAYNKSYGDENGSFIADEKFEKAMSPIFKNTYSLVYEKLETRLKREHPDAKYWKQFKYRNGMKKRELQADLRKEREKRFALFVMSAKQKGQTLAQMSDGNAKRISAL